jgi:raffinose/stachyose/melibiose transport system substrate-binding protein
MRTLRRLPIAVVALAVLAAGCGTPGADSGDNAKKAQEAEKSSRKIDVAKAGNVTLTVWDQEVRGGQAAQIKRLNAAFEAKYPNVKIKRVAKSFEDLQATLKLAVSSNKAPDVVEANQGRPVMGQLVKGGLLKPLDGYAKIFNWQDRWAKTLLDLNSFSPDGKTFGSGNLYGVSQAGEIVGVFYNKDKVATPPKTFAEFEQQLADAKSKGEVPIAFGNLEKWPAIHEFQTVQNQFAQKQSVRDFVFAKPGASFATPENQQAATTLQDWADKGYFTPSFNGTGYDPAWQQFIKGKGRFLIAGTWVVADLAKAMGDKVGFMLMPPSDVSGGKPVSLGGESLPWAITSKSKAPDVAAAYLDFLTNADAAKTLVETDNLPAMKTDAQPTGSLNQDVFAAWKQLSDADGLVPYLDYATPTFYDDITSALQRLLGDKVKPAPFAQGVQAKYQKFTEEL